MYKLMGVAGRLATSRTRAIQIRGISMGHDHLLDVGGKVVGGSAVQYSDDFEFQRKNAELMRRLNEVKRAIEEYEVSVFAGNLYRFGGDPVLADRSRSYLSGLHQIRILVQSLLSIMIPSDVSPLLSYWLSDSAYREIRMNYNIVAHNQMKNALTGWNSELYSARLRTREAICRPFYEAMDGISQIIKCIDIHLQHVPSSFLRQILYACYPDRETRKTGYLIDVYLKNCNDKFSEHRDLALSRALSNDLFQRECEYIVGPMWKCNRGAIHLLRKLFAIHRLTAFQRDTSGQILFKKWPNRRQIEYLEFSIMTRQYSLGRLKWQNAFYEYRYHVYERIGRYKQIVQRDPSKLATISKYMLSTKKPVFRDPQFESRVLQTIEKTKHHLNLLKRGLHGLLHYLAQFEDPSIPVQCRRPLDHYLKRDYAYPAAAKKPMPPPQRQILPSVSVVMDPTRTRSPSLHPDAVRSIDFKRPKGDYAYPAAAKKPMPPPRRQILPSVSMVMDPTRTRSPSLHPDAVRSIDFKKPKGISPGLAPLKWD